MMRISVPCIRSLATLSLCFALLPSCETTRKGPIEVSLAYDRAGKFYAYNNYAWRLQAQTPTSDARLNNPQLHQSIMQSVDSHLAGKGKSKVHRSQANFLIDYEVAIEGEIHYEMIGIEDSSRRWSGRLRPARENYDLGMDADQVVEHVYEKGTIILKIYDGITKNLIWYSTAMADVDNSRTPDERRKLIGKATKEMLDDFPPRANR